MTLVQYLISWHNIPRNISFKTGFQLTMHIPPFSKVFLVTSILLFANSAFSQLENYVYVTNEDSNDVSVISAATNRVVATIPVGKRPRGIKVSPDGSLIYVAVSGSPKCPPTLPDEECEKLVTDASADGIAEIDARLQQVLRILPSGSDPEQFDVNWATNKLYVSNENVNQASILDLTRGEIILSVPTGREPEGVRLTPDGKIFYITGEVDSDITVIDAESGEEITRIPVGLRPRDIIFSPDGLRAYISSEFAATISVIDVIANTMRGEIVLPTGSLPMGLVLSLDATTLYVANGRAGTVVAIDLQTETVTASVEVGPRPWGLAMSPDGRLLYSANGNSDDISVIDIETFSIVTKVAVGETPWGVAIGPVPVD
jgi:YVTN family beta-propeller protein